MFKFLRYKKTDKNININKNKNSKTNNKRRTEVDFWKIRRMNLRMLILILYTMYFALFATGKLVKNVDEYYLNESVYNINSMIDEEYLNIQKMLGNFYYEELNEWNGTSNNLAKDELLEFMTNYSNLYSKYREMFLILKNGDVCIVGDSVAQKVKVENLHFSELINDFDNYDDFFMINDTNFSGFTKEIFFKKYRNNQEEVVAFVGAAFSAEKLSDKFNKVLESVYPNSFMIVDESNSILFSTANVGKVYNSIEEINIKLQEKDIDISKVYSNLKYTWIYNENMRLKLIAFARYGTNLGAFDVMRYGNEILIILKAILIVVFIFSTYAIDKLKNYRLGVILINTILLFLVIGCHIVVKNFSYEKNIKTGINVSLAYQTVFENQLDEKKIADFIFATTRLSKYADNDAQREQIRNSMAEVLKNIGNIRNYEVRTLEATNELNEENKSIITDSYGNALIKYHKTYKGYGEKSTIVTLQIKDRSLEEIAMISKRINGFNNSHIERNKKEIFLFTPKYLTFKKADISEDFRIKELNKIYEYVDGKHILTVEEVEHEDELKYEVGLIEMHAHPKEHKIDVNLLKNLESTYAQKEILFTYNMINFTYNENYLLAINILLYIVTIEVCFYILMKNSKKIVYIEDEDIEDRYNYLNHPITANTYIDEEFSDITDENDKEEDVERANLYIRQVDERIVSTRKFIEEKLSIKKALSYIKKKRSQKKRIPETQKDSQRTTTSSERTKYDESNLIGVEEYMKYEENELKNKK